MLHRARLCLQRHARIDPVAGHGVRGVSLIAHHLDELAAHIFHSLARDALVVGIGELWVEALPTVRLAVTDKVTWRGGAVKRDDRAKLQTVPSPPLDIGLVAECADHQHTGALLRVGFFARENRHLREVSRRDGVLTEQTLVPHIIGMRGNANACGYQFGTRRRYHEGIW